MVLLTIVKDFNTSEPKKSQQGFPTLERAKEYLHHLKNSGAHYFLAGTKKVEKFDSIHVAKD